MVGSDATPPSTPAAHHARPYRIWSASPGDWGDLRQAERREWWLAAGAPSQAWSVACVLEAWWRVERARGVVTR
jgi:hypothetical protein